MTVPFVDLHRQYLRIKDELDAAMAGVIARRRLHRRRIALKIRARFRRLVGYRPRHGMCQRNRLASKSYLDTLGVKAGDEVIVPALSWISTAEAVGTRGAKPFSSTSMKPTASTRNLIESEITRATKGIIPVHCTDVLRTCRASWKSPSVTDCSF